ncbi:MAG TPA: GlsB/YeaQ/YmgE family stress response membrane protein [Polyangia bacterium]|nr:GlsB/YeaQ/YmgE family stress response membrane protein [Polyangia bacterium]
MGLLLFLLFGFVVGLVARAVMPGPDPMGMLATTLLGVGGSFVGWWVGRLLGFYSSTSHVRATGFLMALIGALILLAIGHVLRRAA